MPTVLHCSDLHGNLAWFAWLAKVAPDYDAVVISGDLVDEFATRSELSSQVSRVSAFLRSLTRPLFVVTGNHDASFDLPAIAGANPHVHVDGYDGEHFGWRFVCTGWRQTPLYLPPSRKTLPVILVSHQPPDESAVAQDSRGDWGGFDVRTLTTLLPQGSVVLCGHVHSPRSWHARVGLATAFNPGIAPSTAKVPRHVVLDLTRHRATLGGSAHDAPRVVTF